MMADIISTIKDTPIPTILVIGGLSFLLLSIADQLAGKIVVGPGRQKQSMIIGVILVICGVSLYLLPKSTPQNETSKIATSLLPETKKPQPPKSPPATPNSQTNHVPDWIVLFPNFTVEKSFSDHGVNTIYFSTKANYEDMVNFYDPRLEKWKQEGWKVTLSKTHDICLTNPVILKASISDGRTFSVKCGGKNDDGDYIYILDFIVK